MNYVNYQQAQADVHQHLLPKIPVKELAGVMGVPRSGMIPATIIATELHLPLGMVGFGQPPVHQSGRTTRSSVARPGGKWLVVDDSVYMGGAMRRTRDVLGDSGRFIYASLYMTPGSEQHVDLFGRHLSGPRFFQWNLFSCAAAEKAIFDLDGVFAEEPTAFDDDGAAYQKNIRTARLLRRPGVRLGMILTNRIDRWRALTENWLAQNQIQYEQLVMQRFDSAAQRRAKSPGPIFKGQIYKASNAPFMVESHDHMAEKVAAAAGKPVISVESQTVFQ